MDWQTNIGSNYPLNLEELSQGSGGKEQTKLKARRDELAQQTESMPSQGSGSTEKTTLQTRGDELAQTMIDTGLQGYKQPRLEIKPTAFLETLVKKLEKLGSSSVSDELLVRVRELLADEVLVEADYHLALVALLLKFKDAAQTLKDAAKEPLQFNLGVDSSPGCVVHHQLGIFSWNAYKLHFVKHMQDNEDLRNTFCRVMKCVLVQRKVDVIMLQEVPKKGKTVKMFLAEINKVVVKYQDEYDKQRGLFELIEPKGVDGRVVSSTHALLVRKVKDLECEHCWCMAGIERLDAGCSGVKFHYPPLVATFNDTRYTDLSLRRQVVIGVHTPGSSEKKNQRDTEMNAMYRFGPDQVSATPASLDIRATFHLCPYGINPPMSLRY